MSARVTIIQRIISLFHRRTWLVIRDPARVELSPITPGCRSSMSVYFYFFFFLSFFLSNTSNTRGIGIFPARIRICLDRCIPSEREIFFASILGRKTRRRKRFFRERKMAGVSLFLIEVKLTVLREGEGRAEGVERLYSNEQWLDAVATLIIRFDETKHFALFTDYGIKKWGYVDNSKQNEILETIEIGRRDGNKRVEIVWMEFNGVFFEFFQNNFLFLFSFFFIQGKEIWNLKFSTKKKKTICDLLVSWPGYLKKGFDNFFRKHEFFLSLFQNT